MLKDGKENYSEVAATKHRKRKHKKRHIRKTTNKHRKRDNRQLKQAQEVE